MALLVRSNEVQQYQNIRDELAEVSSLWNVILSWGPSAFVLRLIMKLFSVFFLWPMWHLYRNGPSIGGFGFWAGKSSSDICATMTHVDSNFWESSIENMNECELIIIRQFESIVIGFFMIGYLIIAGKVVCWILSNIQKTSSNLGHNIVKKMTKLSKEDSKLSFIDEKNTPSNRRKKLKKSFSNELYDDRKYKRSSLDDRKFFRTSIDIDNK